MSEQWVDFDSVKAAVTVEQILTHYGITNLRRERGDELRGSCPIHQGDGKRSFHISKGKKAFCCFACGAKGNLIDFVAAMEKCSFREAALKLQDWLGIQAGPGQCATPTRRLARPEAGEQATGPELAREKRVGDQNPSTEAGVNSGEKEPNKPLGFKLQGILHDYLYLDKRGISKQTAEYFGVGFFGGKGSMSGRVVIPIHNEKGVLVAYAGRSIDNSEPRYKLPPGFHKSLELYNLHRAIEAEGQYRGLVVVEGFFDCMKVHQAGYPFVVALMGCSMSLEQERLLVSSVDRVKLMLDGDEAGWQGTDDILRRLGRKMWVSAVTLPEGQQPDQMTADEIEELLKR